MPPDRPRLPRYSECMYSLFISYAHDDDSGNNWWVTSLKDVIYLRLGLMHRDIPKLKIHFSAQNGPTGGGQLGFELEDRVKQSFAVLLVVGKKYLESRWCEKELGFFSRTFGQEGVKNRLLIAVMSEDELKKAQIGSQWKQTIAPDQIFVSMFDPQGGNKPLNNKMNDGSPGVPGAFFENAAKIADKLIEKIESDVEASNTSSQADSAGTLATTPWSVDASQQLHIVIGPSTDNLAGNAAMLRDAIAQTAANVVVLNRKVIDDYDPDDGTPLRPALLHADILVVPITHGKPLRPDIDGGHAAILSKEWTALNKRRSIVWYRPDDVEIKLEDKAAVRHLKIFSQLAPVCVSEKAVASLIFGPNIGNAVKIYIEKHTNVPYFWPLANRLGEAWSSLQGYPDRPQLICQMLDFNMLESVPKDAAGFVLLLPQRLKPYDALQAQQSLVMKYFEKKTAAYPGVVALIFKEQGRPASGLNWPLLEFLDSGKSSTLNLDKDSEPWLEAFLREILNQSEPNRTLPQA